MGKQKTTRKGRFAPVPAGTTSSLHGRRRLQELPYDIQEAIWKDVVDEIRPRVLFLDVDGLRDVRPKAFRDGQSDSYKYLESCAGTWNEDYIPHPGIVETTKRLVTRERLRLSTRVVREIGSLCANSRHAIVKAFPHAVGLGFTTWNGCRDVGLLDAILRFNGDEDICMLSAAQWERQIHFLLNQTSMTGALNNIKNLGLDLGTMWNDRLLQTLVALMEDDPAAMWRRRRTQVEFDNPQTEKLPLNPRHLEWKGSCGCLAPTATREDSDWNPLAWAARPRYYDGGRLPDQSNIRSRICRGVCKREPFPLFVNALPDVRTLVLADTGRTIHPVPRWLRKHNEHSSSLNEDGHTLITDGMDTYVVIDLLDDRRPNLLPQPLTAARTNWHRDYPYAARIPSATAKIMRPMNKRRTNAEGRQTGDQSDNDIPFIYEMETTPDAASQSNLGRKRPAPASRDMAIPKRGKTGPS